VGDESEAQGEKSEKCADGGHGGSRFDLRSDFTVIGVGVVSRLARAEMGNPVLCLAAPLFVLWEETGWSGRISSMCAMASPASNVSVPGGSAGSRAWIYYLLFFLSGFPALLYQIVWQRTLFTLFGTNVESVTLVVTVFMLGLGLGSLVGGVVSARKNVRLLAAFGAAELCVGAFGAGSLGLFHRVASFTAGRSLAETGVVAFCLLLVPTLLMGSTLPLLSEHFVRRTGNVGESVGLLYGVNTLGSGLACLVAALFLMHALGERGSVWVAVCLNLVVGGLRAGSRIAANGGGRASGSQDAGRSAAEDSSGSRDAAGGRNRVCGAGIRDRLVQAVCLRFGWNGSVFCAGAGLLPVRDCLRRVRSAVREQGQAEERLPESHGGRG
jgi:MFS family permease